jgi:hypothetical protein
VQIHLAYVRHGHVAVSLRPEGICGTGVVGSLGLQRGGGNNGQSPSEAEVTNTQNESDSKKKPTHLHLDKEVGAKSEVSPLFTAPAVRSLAL